MKYVLKAEAQAYTFEEVVQYGRGWYAAKELELIRGMPWSFEFHGLPLTHETDSCYVLVGPMVMTEPEKSGSQLLTPEAMLVHWPSGLWSAEPKDEFLNLYKPA